MRRVLMVLALVAAAGIGAYGQTSREGIRNTFDAVNEGGTYQASLCSDKTWLPGSAYANAFNMHVTKPLNNGWFEAEVGAGIDVKTRKLLPPFETVRINTARLCYVKPIIP